MDPSRLLAPSGVQLGCGHLSHLLIVPQERVVFFWTKGLLHIQPATDLPALLQTLSRANLVVFRYVDRFEA